VIGIEKSQGRGKSCQNCKKKFEEKEEEKHELLTRKEGQEDPEEKARINCLLICSLS